MSAIYKNGVQYVGVTDASSMSVDVGQNTLNLEDTLLNIIDDLAPVETNPATNQHSVGDLITYNGALYKVIDDIDEEDALVIGTNITETSFSNQIQRIDNSSSIYAITITQLYEKIDNLELYKVANFACSAEVASIITNNLISSMLKGFVCKMDQQQKIFDFFTTNSNSLLFGFRIRFTSPSTIATQKQYSALGVHNDTIKAGTVQCQYASDPQRIISYSYDYQDDVSPYDRVQVLGQTNGFRLVCKDRTSQQWATISAAPSLIRGEQILENTNLDNCTTIGTYYCPATTTVRTLTNCPTTEAFTMDVMCGQGTGYPTQILRKYNNFEVYRRSNISNTWQAWQVVTPVTGAASSISTANLTTGRVLVSNDSGKVGVSVISSDTLYYLKDATSNIQNQINGKAPTSHASSATTYGVASTANYGHVKYGTTSGTACQGNDSRLSNARTPVAHASTATTYGIGTGSNYGHVKLSDTYASTVANNAAANGMGASQRAVYNVYSLVDSLIQRSGTITASAVPVFGIITGGQKSVILFIPWFKKIVTSSPTITSITLSVRHINGGYIGNADGFNATSIISGTVARTNQGIIQVTLTRSTNFEAPNNTPVCGTIDLTIKFP